MFIRLYSSARSGSQYIIHFWGIPVAFLVALFHRFINPFYSVTALRGIGQECEYFPIFWITLFSSSANSAVPFPAGIPLKALLQKKLLNISYQKSASAILVETFLGYGVTIIAATMTTVLWLRPYLNPSLSGLKQYYIIPLFGMGVLITIFLMRGMLIKLRGVLWQKLSSVIKLISRTRISSLAIMLLLLVVAQILAVTRLQVLLSALGHNVPVLPLLAAMMLSYLAGVISFVPMGLGVRDISLASLLLLLGVPAEITVAVTAMDRFFIMFPYLVGGVLATGVLGRKYLKSGQQTVPG